MQPFVVFSNKLYLFFCLLTYDLLDILLIFLFQFLRLLVLCVLLQKFHLVLYNQTFFLHLLLDYLCHFLHFPIEKFFAILMFDKQHAKYHKFQFHI